MPAMIGPVTWSAYRSVSMTWSMSISVRTGTARRRAEVIGVRALAAATSPRSRSGSTPGAATR
jgi:thiazole synthase ThiGH ThiG subunit